MPATNGYPNTVIFPADDEMTVVMQGPFNGDRKPEPDIWRGVKRILTTPSYESAHYTQNYDPELAAKALQPYARATIGFVGIYQMSFAMGDYIMRPSTIPALSPRRTSSICKSTRSTARASLRSWPTLTSCRPTW